MEDFEDRLLGVQQKIKADYIVTRNAADFVRSDIPVSTRRVFSRMENLVHEKAEFLEVRAASLKAGDAEYMR